MSTRETIHAPARLRETVQQAIESSAVRDEEHEKKLLQEYIDELESIVIEAEMRKVRYRYGGGLYGSVVS